MAEITKVVINYSNGEQVSINANDLKPATLRKFRKEAQKFSKPLREVITEPKLNEEVNSG